MKILDAPSQFKNVRNTTSQCHRHQLRQKIHHVRQKYIMYAKQNTTYTKHQVHQTKTKFFNQNTKYAKQNTKYAKQNTKYWFTLFCREINFVANLRTFWRTFYRPKKYGGVPKMTIIRYGNAPLVWRKFWPKIVSVEKKLQIWGMCIYLKNVSYMLVIVGQGNFAILAPRSFRTAQ